VLRSLGSAGLRFERQCQNAQALAVMLRAHPGVKSVRYPGLPDDPSHQIATLQMKRYGGLVAVELEDAAAVHALVERSALVIASTSFGGIHTSLDRRARWGDPVSAGFARISLGIEDTDDLIADFEEALAERREVRLRLALEGGQEAFCQRGFDVGVGNHEGAYDHVVAVEEQTSQRGPVGAHAADQLFAERPRLDPLEIARGPRNLRGGHGTAMSRLHLCPRIFDGAVYDDVEGIRG